MNESLRPTETTGRRAIARPSAVAAATLCWAGALIALAVGASLACPGGACGPLDLDRQGLGALHGWQNAPLDAALRAATWLGSVLVLLPLALALAWHYRRSGLREAAVLLPLSVAGAWVLAHAWKLLVARPRPGLHAALVDMPTDLSFPSAHALQVAAFAVAWLFAPGIRRRWRHVAAAVALVAVVALSRPYLQVHFPSDVLFGVIAGTGWALGLSFLARARNSPAGRPEGGSARSARGG